MNCCISSQYCDRFVACKFIVSIVLLSVLIYEDLKIYGKSAIGEIHKRIGEEIPLRSVRQQLENLSEEEKISKEGEKRGTKYFIDEFV